MCARMWQNNHVCVENSMRQNCPVCFEYLFDSVRPTAVLPCGHTIHSDCLKEMERNRQVRWAARANPVPARQAL